MTTEIETTEIETTESEPVVTELPRASRRFVRALLLIAVGALALRWAWILLALRHVPLGKGDGYFYYRGAQLLVDGKGFIQPQRYDQFHIVDQAASHPPGYMLFMAGLILIGIKGLVAQMMASAVLGAGTVVAIGFAARRIGGDTVGLVAAAIAAVYANLWAADGSLMSETLAMLMAALVVIAAYRFADARNLPNAALLGLAIGAAAMARSELIMVALLAATPLCLSRRTGEWPRRLAALALCGATCAAMIAPWVIYNHGRFVHPVYLSAGLEITMAVANCDSTYDIKSGNFAYWDYYCQFPIDRAAERRGLDSGEESERSLYMRQAVQHFVSEHKLKLPVVLAARLGRLTGLYRVEAQRVADVAVEGRPAAVATTASVQYLLLAPFGLGGVLVLRRRRRQLYPLLALVGTVVISTLLTWPNTRYRAPAEPAICILAAVAIVALVGRVRRIEQRSVEPPAEPAGDAGAAEVPEPVAHLRGLDGVRAIAAAGVLVSHVAIGSGFVNADRWASLPTVVHPLRSLLARGDVGVAIFFMLSGFLMYRPIAAALHRGDRLPDWRRYTVRRIARIFPLYWLVTTVAIVIQTTGVFGGARTKFPPALDLVRYYTLTHIYWFHTVIAPVGPSWSLATETSFYLFLPLFAIALWRWCRRDGRVAVTSHVTAILGLVAFSILFKGAVVLFTKDVVGHVVANDTRGLLRSWLPSNLDLFGIGMLMAVIWVSGTPRRVMEHRWAAGASWVCAGLAYWWSSHSLGLPDFQANYSSTQELTRQIGYAAVAFFLLAPACFGLAEEGRVRRLLQSKGLVWCGLISYGIYLWHQVISDVWFRVTGNRVFRAPVLTELIWIVGVSLAVASLTYVVLERPVLSCVTDRLARRRERVDG